MTVLTLDASGVLGKCERPTSQLNSVPAAKESAFHKAIFHGSSLARISKDCRLYSYRTFCSPRLASPCWLEERLAKVSPSQSSEQSHES